MMHVVESLRDEADRSIALMKEAALAARNAHARAELMRHMLTTARKVAHHPRAQAVEQVVGEWLDAWNLDRAAWPEVAREMRALTDAFLDYAVEASDAHDARLREAAAALDAALAGQGTTLADQMAWRSQCAHGWWASVVPPPPDLPGQKARPGVPRPREDEPFWQAGCAEFCR